MGTKPEKVGVLDEKVVSILNLNLQPDTPIFIAETNVEHIKKRHPKDFDKYGENIEEIIADPDFIAEHPNNGSIQYIKAYYDEETSDKVLVAVRSSKRGKLFVRSLFVMSKEKYQSYKTRGALKKYK